MTPQGSRFIVSNIYHVFIIDECEQEIVYNDYLIADSRDEADRKAWIQFEPKRKHARDDYSTSVYLMVEQRVLPKQRAPG